MDEMIEAELEPAEHSKAIDHCGAAAAVAAHSMMIETRNDHCCDDAAAHSMMIETHNDPTAAHFAMAIASRLSAAACYSLL